MTSQKLFYTKQLLEEFSVRLCVGIADVTVCGIFITQKALSRRKSNFDDEAFREAYERS
jgi:hypothetical protein